MKNKRSSLSSMGSLHSTKPCVTLLLLYDIIPCIEKLSREKENCVN